MSNQSASSAGRTDFVEAGRQAAKKPAINPERRAAPAAPSLWSRLSGSARQQRIEQEFREREERERAEADAERKREAAVAAEREAERQAVEVERMRLRTARKDGIDQLRELSEQKPRLTVAFIGVKGGAATTTTMVYSSSILSDITRSSVIVSDFNPAAGTAGMALGKDHDATMTLQQLRMAIENDEINEPSDLMSRIRPTPYGVRVVSANDYVGDSSEPYGESTEQMLNTLRRHAEYNFIDTANDITSTSSRAVLRAADVLVFTANVGSRRSLFQLGTSMETARRLGFTDKVERSIVVISSLLPGDPPDNYRKYLDKVNSLGEVVQEYGFTGPVLGVPFDGHINRDTEVDLEQIEWNVYQAYLDLDLTIFGQLNIP